jgi:hypothetical protein
LKVKTETKELLRDVWFSAALLAFLLWLILLWVTGCGLFNQDHSATPFGRAAPMQNEKLKVQKVPPLPPVQTFGTNTVNRELQGRAVVSVPRGVHSVSADFQVPWYRQTQWTNGALTTNWLAFASDAVAEAGPSPNGPWTEFARQNIPAAWLGTNRVYGGQWLTWFVPFTNDAPQKFVRFHYTLPAN